MAAEMQQPAQASGTFDFTGRAHMVLDHHLDELKSGRPLWLVVPGGLVAVISVVLGLYVYIETLTGNLTSFRAGQMLVGVGLIFIASAFAFSYGWELYDVNKALRLTFVICVVVVGVVVVLMAFGALLPNLNKVRRVRGITWTALFNLLLSGGLSAAAYVGGADANPGPVALNAPAVGDDAQPPAP